MKDHGQKIPVLGRHVRDINGCRFELIYGARRLVAARLLAVDLVVEVKDIDDRAALIEMDIENRVRLDISPYERGLSYQRWLRKGHFSSQSDLAEAVGISEAQVSRLLRYGELPALVVSAFPSPRDIREEWAVTLVRNLKNIESERRGIISRARRLVMHREKTGCSAQYVYETLLSSRSAGRMRSKARDEVVTGLHGNPLFRVGRRSSSVHLIIPKNRLTDNLIDVIVRQLQETLEDQQVRRDPARLNGAKPLRSSVVAPHSVC
jgi:ParB/RepB/Spo0J family partition protein